MSDGSEEWTKLVRHAEWIAWRICNRCRRWHPELQDMKQEAVIELWRAWERYRKVPERSDATFYGYAMAYVRWAMWRYLKRQHLKCRDRVDREIQPIPKSVSLFSPFYDDGHLPIAGDDVFEHWNARMLIDRAVDVLRGQQRLVILHRLSGYSVEETADLLITTKSSILSLQKRAMRNMRKELGAPLHAEQTRGAF
jgi:RNA polymerase sigma factor (sigma-70 family)